MPFHNTGVQRAWECLPVTAQHAVEGYGSNQKLPGTLFQDKAVPVGASQMSQRLTPSRNGRVPFCGGELQDAKLSKRYFLQFT